MTDLETSKQLRFIIDEPAEQDFFKTHVPIARSIGLAIWKNPRLRVIGLLGRWGSGKSTIVSEIERQLNQLNKKYIVFTYDAWLHQNDPIRRSFLESLAKFLWERGVVKQDDWEQKLRRLAGTLEVVDKVETPTVTAEAKQLFLLGVLFSLGLLMAKDTFKDALKSNHDDVSLWGFRFALIMILIPPIFLTCKAIYFRWVGKKFHIIPRLLLNKEIAHTNIVTQKPIDPSSIEFGEIFRVLMMETAAAGRLPIIVIDNIDRLSDEESMQIWASIRSFFLAEHSGDALNNQSYHPIVILPIDGQAIAQMFSVGKADPQTGAQLAASFINKTFDVKFNVPNPVMSDWKLYLKSQMEKSLGNMFEEMRYYKTKSYLEKWFDKTATPITPREISKALNRIIALLLQWEDSSVDFESIAYYSINRAEIDRNIGVAVADQNNPLQDETPNWQRQIAALHFGVEVEHAAQVLMTQPLKESFLNGDPASVDRFRNIGGFGDTFEALTAELAVDSETVPTLSTILNIIGFIPEATIADDIWIQSSWRNLTRAFSRIRQFPPQSRMAERLTRLTAKVESSDAYDYLRSLERLADENLSSERATNSVVKDAISIGAEAIELANRYQLDAPVFDVAGPAAQYMSRLHAASEVPIVQNRMRTKLGDADLVAELNRRVADPLVADTVPSLIRLFQAPSPTSVLDKIVDDLAPLTTAAEAVIRSSGGDTPQYRSAFSIFEVMEPLDLSARQAIGRLAADGTFGKQLSVLAKTADARPIYVSIAAIIWKEVSIPLPIAAGWRSFFAQFPEAAVQINSVLDTLIGDGGAALDNFLTLYSRDKDVRPLISTLFENRIERADLGRLYPAKVLQNFRSYAMMVDSKYKDALASQLASGYVKFSAALNDASWNISIFDAAERLKRSGGDGAENFQSELIKKVAETSVDDWQLAIDKGSEPFKVFTETLNGVDIKVKSESPILRALQLAIDRQSSLDRTVLGRWFSIAQNLPASARKTIYGLMAASFSKRSPEKLLAILTAGGPKFVREAGVIRGNALLGDNIILPLATIATGRLWLNDQRSDIKSAISKLSSIDRASIADKMGAMEQSKLATRKAWAGKAIKDWGL